jgi:hypothetical protein
MSRKLFTLAAGVLAVLCAGGRGEGAKSAF